ncbi:MAG: hypothetical protein ACR2MA_06195 [Egibacteraceae bacterium]
MSWLRRALRSRWLRWLGGGGVALVLILVGLWFLPPAVGAAVLRPVLSAFAEADLPRDLEIPAERSVLQSSNGQRLAVLFNEENRVRVEPSEIPELVRNAVLATEIRASRVIPASTTARSFERRWRTCGLARSRRAVPRSPSSS